MNREEQISECIGQLITWFEIGSKMWVRPELCLLASLCHPEPNESDQSGEKDV